MAALKFARQISVDRLANFVSPNAFSDVNLFSKLYKECRSDCVELSTRAIPDLKRVSFKEAVKGDFKPTKIGESFGPSWSTHWFHVKIHVPKHWHGEEVWFVWDADNEGFLFTTDGQPIQAFTGGDGWDRRADYILTKKAAGGDVFEFYLEMACNGMFGVGNNGMINAPDPNRYFKLKTAELRVPNNLVWNIWHDYSVIAEMAKELPADSQRGTEALVTANKIINTFRHDGPSTWEEASMVARKFLQEPTSEHSHHITAVPMCHIDSFWLWESKETIRKVARSWATQLKLCEDYPEYRFAFSQMQQIAWLKDYYPGLFKRVQEAVKCGKFIPVGGTWVEADGNLPSGESFVRQCLYGQKFLKENFGMIADVFWLPDTFGYAAQLPQIVKNAGLKYFLTQKLSWNNINKFPYTTFYWVALDGTRVLTHFPPADSYTSQMNVKEVLYAVKNNKDKEHMKQSMYLFGNGDGGGGATPAMLERYRRMSNLNGLPKIEYGNPSEFFKNVDSKSGQHLLEWKGELYFELHRGTYTSQAFTKKYNRFCEVLLRNVEFFSAQAMLHGYNYPQQELERLWKLVLLCQFHDALPGSSIELVYDELKEMYHDVEKSGSTLLEHTQKYLAHHGKNSEMMAWNTTSWIRSEVIEVPLGGTITDVSQKTADGKGLVYAENVKPFSSKPLSVKSQVHPVQVRQVDNTIVMENELVRVIVDNHGSILSYFVKSINRDAIKPKGLGNRFKIYEDVPLFWDAWDVEVYHLDKGWDAGHGTVSIEEIGPLRASILLKAQITKTSTLVQRIQLCAGSPRLDFETEVEWHENRRFLKVEFDVNVKSDVATYETAYGWVQRPAHFNTSWDLAKFEVCVHRFANLSEYGFGVSIYNDCKYGFATHGQTMRLSLLRSPKSPDEHCDMGRHTFRYAFEPHVGSFLESDTVAHAYQYNTPLLLSPAKHENPFIEVVGGSKNVVIDCVKKSEDGNDLIFRVYEAYGGRGKVSIQTAFAFDSVSAVDLLEAPQENNADLEKGSSNAFSFVIHPFQVLTFKLVPTKASK